MAGTAMAMGGELRGGLPLGGPFVEGLEAPVFVVGEFGQASADQMLPSDGGVVGAELSATDVAPMVDVSPTDEAEKLLGWAIGEGLVDPHALPSRAPDDIPEGEPVALLGALLTRPAPYKKLKPGGPDAAVSTKAVEAGYLAEVPTSLQRRGDTPQAPFIAPATVREARRNAGLDGAWPVLAVGAGGAATAVTAVAKGAALLPVAGAAVVGVLAPVLTGYKLGDFASRNESLNMEDRDKRVAKLASQLGWGAIALAAGAIEGAAGGAIVGGLPGAVVGAAVGAGVGLASYVFGRRRRGLFLRHVARGRAEEIAKTSNTGEMEIAKDQALEIEKHGEYEPGTEAMAQRKASEAEVRGPVVRGLASMIGAAGLAAAGVWGAGKLGIGAGLTLVNGALIAGGALLFGGSMAAGRGFNKLTENWESRWAPTTVKALGGLVVTAAGASAGFLVAGPGGAVAGGAVAAAGFAGGYRMRTNEVRRREAANAPPAIIQASSRRDRVGHEAAVVTTNDASADADVAPEQPDAPRVDKTTRSLD